MLKGLRTATFKVTDIATARDWYSKVLEYPPYFDQPFYVGFNVGGFELGLVPEGKAGPGGTVAYWGVVDAAKAMDRLVSLGAVIQDPLQHVGEGIRLGTVTDPFGNTLGIMENPNFKPELVR